jgi:hypothetical protein
MIDIIHYADMLRKGGAYRDSNDIHQETIVSPFLKQHKNWRAVAFNNKNRGRQGKERDTYN